MDTPVEWRKMLLEYRLHEVDDVRRGEIDALLIADAEFADAMQEAEYDLLDAYAAGELRAEEMRRVERALDPVGRFSPALAGHVILSQSGSGVRRGVVSRPSLWRMAAAAVLVVGASAGVVVYRHVGAGNPPLERQSVTAASAAPVVHPESALPPGATAKHTEGISTAVVVLAGALRSQDALPLSLTTNEKAVRFWWTQVAALPSGKEYELQVVRQDGSVSCRSVAVVRGVSDRLGFLCPAASIPDGISFVRVMEMPLSPDSAPVLEVSLSATRN